MKTPMRTRKLLSRAVLWMIRKMVELKKLAPSSLIGTVLIEMVLIEMVLIGMAPA